MSHYRSLSVEEVFSDVGWKALSETLLKGGLVIMPSDTTYACVVDASQQAAVEKLIASKARPSGKAISVFVSSLKEAEKYVDISDDQRITLSALLPGPYTVILQSKHRVSKLLEAENGTLGIRVPHYDFLHKVTKKYGLPLTATSANLAGKSPHYSVEALLNSLSETKKDMIDVIVDAGPLPHNKPSTVIDISGGSIRYNGKDTRDYSREELRSQLNVKPAVLALYLGIMPEIVSEREVLRLSDHRKVFDYAQQSLIEQLMISMQQTPPPSFAEAAAMVGEEVLHALIEMGEIIQLSADVIIAHTIYVENVTAALSTIDATGAITVANLRDQLGTSRKFALALLEHLDAAGVTRRQGDVRVRR